MVRIRLLPNGAVITILYGFRNTEPFRLLGRPVKRISSNGRVLGVAQKIESDILPIPILIF